MYRGLPARRLVGPCSPCRVRVEQLHPCLHEHHPVLHQLRLPPSLQPLDSCRVREPCRRGPCPVPCRDPRSHSPGTCQGPDPPEGICRPPPPCCSRLAAWRPRVASP